MKKSSLPSEGFLELLLGIRAGSGALDDSAGCLEPLHNRKRFKSTTDFLRDKGIFLFNSYMVLSTSRGGVQAVAFVGDETYEDERKRVCDTLTRDKTCTYFTGSKEGSECCYGLVIFEPSPMVFQLVPGKNGPNDKLYRNGAALTDIVLLSREGIGNPTLVKLKDASTLELFAFFGSELYKESEDPHWRNHPQHVREMLNAAKHANLDYHHLLYNQNQIRGVVKLVREYLL